MTDKKAVNKELSIKLVQAKNGGFALHIDGEFDTACSKGDEALEWFAGLMKERFGETTRRAVEHSTILDQLASRVAEKMAADNRPLPAPQKPQQGHGVPQHPMAYSGNRLPPELPPEAIDPMPRVVEDMRQAEEAGIDNLAARLSTEMNRPTNGHGAHRSSVIALIAIPIAIKLWMSGAAFGLS